MIMNDMIHGGEWTGNDIKIDFSVNLNPAGIPEAVKRLLQNAHPADFFGRYPDRECDGLRSLIAYKYKVDKENIICGNGASELITNILRAFSILGIRKVMLPIPTFLGYERGLKAPCLGDGLDIVFYSLDRREDLAFTERFLDAIEEFAGKGISEDKALILCNPNNPTGRLMDKELFDKVIFLCKEHGIRIVVDECFLGFCADGDRRSLKGITADNPHVCVIDAFTKLYSIPGVRLGFMISEDKRFNDTVRSILPEWNVSVPACEIGRVILEEVKADYLTETRELVKREREYLCEELKKLGFIVCPGDTCFILFRTPEEEKYDDLQLKLAEAGILIRNCGNFKGLDRYDHRIAVRTHRDNEILITILRECFV